MAVVRRNVVKDAAARASYIEGVKRLKAEQLTAADGTPLTTAAIPGIILTPPAGHQPLSTYDLFVLWHYYAMGQLTPVPSDEFPNENGRNAAHSGPAFLPWHRLMLMLLEANLARVLDEPAFGLPYWDWAEDGELSPDAQPMAELWTAADGIGGDGDAEGTVQGEPFGSGTAFRVRIESDDRLSLFAVDRPLRRRLRSPLPIPSTTLRWRLPRRAAVRTALEEPEYDRPPWDGDSDTGGFRNRVEGWRDSRLRLADMHNLVHVWVSGDMGPATSPNDPVFYLNHCNVDRIWAAWQAWPGDRGFRPVDAESDELFRHRPSDPLFSPFFPKRDAQGGPTEWLVQDMLDVSTVYTYDDLGVDG